MIEVGLQSTYHWKMKKRVLKDSLRFRGPGGPKTPFLARVLRPAGIRGGKGGETTANGGGERSKM